MNQTQTSGPRSTKAHMSEMTASSLLHKNFLSSYDHINYQNIGQILQNGLSQQEKDTLTINFLQNFGPNMPTYPLEVLLK